MKSLTDARRGRKAAFSLIELLVSLSIIAALAALLIPTAGKIRDGAKRVQCVNQLRAWGRAILGYASDNNGNVQFTNWASVGSGSRFYESYLGGVDGEMTQKFRGCPAIKWDGQGSPPTHYAMVRPSPIESGGHKFILTRATRLPGLMLMTEILGEGASLTISTVSQFESLVKPVCVPLETARHNGKVNLVFGDGHVEALGWSQLDGSNPEKAALVENMLKLQP